MTRPLGRKAYGSIGHLPGSRVGPGDHHIEPSQARLLTELLRGPDAEVFVQEKLDGSCVCAARVGDALLALGRDGTLAARSPNEGRRLWAGWVERHSARLLGVLRDGERLVGEWLALVHGTRYQLAHEPFVPFDLISGEQRAAHDDLQARLAPAGFTLPGLLHRGAPLAVAEALARLAPAGRHGAIDPPEGAIWRLERRSAAGVRRVELIAKYVRHDKRDGAFLPENTGLPALWNWRPPASD